MQATLIKVVPHWSRLHGNPDGYVRTVMVRESVGRWRRRRWREVLGADHAEPAVAADDDRDARVDLQRALAALAPKQRAAIVLRYLEDLSVTETAVALGVSEGTVKTQTRDALARLRQLLPDLGLGDEESSGTLVP